MNPRAWLLPMVTGVVGLAAGLLISQQSAEPAKFVHSLDITGGELKSVHASSHELSRSTESVGGPSLQEIRSIVREELAAYSNLAARDSSSRSNKTAPQSKHDDEAIPPSPTQVVTASRLHSAVDAAIARRQWTERDAQQLGSEFDSLTTEQRQEVLQKLIVAINTGQVMAQTDKLF